MNDDRLVNELAREERSVVALAFGMALLFVLGFGLLHAAPGLPAEVHAALTCVRT
jgi:hypothetical protein